EFNIVAHEASKQVIYKSFTKGLNVSIQPMLLRHILQNIIQNAVAFTPPKSSVRVSSFIYRSCFIVRVQDCGPGFPKDLDIFAPFKRSKTSKGTGLGLFLAKNSVDSLGAKLLFKNKKVTSGAVVTLLLPLEL
ncbi:MAG TPA: ATP-binding protein, partial [Nitratifractor sp.]|nr:ATP-binding protein [Nitratifractor sp.]